jgi:nucleoid DNA-binding protein
MTKAEFVKDYGAFGGCTRGTAKLAYEFFVGYITHELADKGVSHIAGLGTFQVKTTAKRPMPNQPGIFTVPRQIVKFKASTLLNDAVDLRIPRSSMTRWPN